MSPALRLLQYLVSSIIPLTALAIHTAKLKAVVLLHAKSSAPFRTSITALQYDYGINLSFKQTKLW